MKKNYSIFEKTGNSTDLIIQVLNHEVPDRLPKFTLGPDSYFNQGFMNEIGFTNEEYEMYSKLKLFNVPPINLPYTIKLGFDGAWIINTPSLHLEDNTLVDTFGAKQAFVSKDGITSLWYNGPYLTTDEKIREWWLKKRPRKSSSNFGKIIKKKREICHDNFDGFCILSGVSGPFECISMPLGMGFMTRIMRKKPELVKEFMDRNWEIQKRGLKSILKNGQKIILCGDDYGMNDGLIMNIKYWKQFIKPVLQRYVDLVHDYNGKFILHSCGRIGDLFPDFVELGIDGVQSLKPYNNDLVKLKKQYGKHIILLGGIDDTHLLIEETPKTIYDTVLKQCEKLGKGGGWIPGPTNWIANVPPKNLIAMMKAIHDFNPK